VKLYHGSLQARAKHLEHTGLRNPYDHCKKSSRAYNCGQGAYDYIFSFLEPWCLPAIKYRSNTSEPKSKKNINVHLLGKCPVSCVYHGHRIRVWKTYTGVASRNFWIYLYISVRFPSWAIHASRRGAGVSSNFLALARLTKNGNNAFPKCFVDCVKQHDVISADVLILHLQKQIQKLWVNAPPPLEALLGGSRRP
jgi:hypothetical protein